MQILIAILASRGVLEIVEWFGEVDGVAEYVILGLAAMISSALMVIWKEGT